MSEESEEAVVFKKPFRRGNMRKRERAVDEPEEAADGTSMSLEMMRELQKQRQRSKGVTLEAKGALEEVDEALAGGSTDLAAEGGLETTFTSQTDSGEIDHQMLKYIEEQMQGGGDEAGGSEQRKVAIDPEEAELYTTPANLIGVVPGGAEADVTEDSANRWLAGIMEVELSTEDKIASIEATEKAKRMMMERHACKAKTKEASGDAHAMVVPANYNSNFHQHRRENAIARKAQFGGKGQGKGGGGGKGQGNMASDSAAFGRFRAHERRMGR